MSFDLNKLQGIFPPIITPINEDETVDHASLKNVVNFVIGKGVHGIWTTGTTGEFPCFSEEERFGIVKSTVEANAGRVPIVASIGDCSTKLAIRQGLRAKEAGADVVACTPPHYFMNNHDELLTHYRRIREAVELPLMVYHIPQTVKVKMEVRTIMQLAKEGTIIGIKDSQNDLDWFRMVMTGTREAGLNFRGFLGTRYLIDASVLIGGHGSIPGVSNAAPALCVAIHNAAAAGDWATAAREQEMLAKLFTDISTIPATKAAMKILGVVACSKSVGPTATPDAAQESRIKTALASVGLLQMAVR